MKFQDFLQTQNEAYILDINSIKMQEVALALENSIALQYLLDHDGQLNEGIESMISGALKKVGLHLTKGNGLIQMLSKASVTVSKVIYLAVMGTKDPAYKAQLKDYIESNKVDKAQIFDFLLKLDTLSLHMLSAPIHILDAITGWHIGPDLHAAGHDTPTDKINSVIKDLKSLLDSVPETIKDLINATMRSLQTL